MAKSNSSIRARAGSGATIATNTVDGKEHLILMEADHLGHLVGSRSGYTIFSSPTAHAANKSILLIHNALGNSIYTFRVKGIWIIPSQLTITTAAMISYNINKVSNPGGVGTTITAQKLDQNAATLSTPNTNFYFRAGANTGLPAVSYTYFSAYTWMDEINAANGLMPYQNQLPRIFDRPTEIVLREGEGLEVRQGAEAITEGTVSVLIHFEVD